MARRDGSGRRLDGTARDVLDGNRAQRFAVVTGRHTTTSPLSTGCSA
ncbi:hypothetical protein [Nocardia araoensis]|nr:hypothetical protein [Nocardia araoensis]